MSALALVPPQGHDPCRGVVCLECALERLQRNERDGLITVDSFEVTLGELRRKWLPHYRDGVS